MCVNNLPRVAREAERPGLEPASSRLQVRRPITTTNTNTNCPGALTNVRMLCEVFWIYCHYYCYYYYYYATTPHSNFQEKKTIKQGKRVKSLSSWSVSTHQTSRKNWRQWSQQVRLRCLLSQGRMCPVASTTHSLTWRSCRSSESSICNSLTCSETLNRCTHINEAFSYANHLRMHLHVHA